MFRSFLFRARPDRNSRGQHDAQLDYYGKRLATCSSDRTVKVFDVVDGETHRSGGHTLKGCADARDDAGDSQYLHAPSDTQAQCGKSLGRIPNSVTFSPLVLTTGR